MEGGEINMEMEARPPKEKKIDTFIWALFFKNAKPNQSTKH